MPRIPPHRSPSLERPDGPLSRNPYELLDQADDINARIAGLQAALEHHERLATLGTIAGLIAHEFNNILTPVMSYAQMALAKPGDRALAEKALHRAVEGTERAASIASAILGFVRDESSIARRHAVPDGESGGGGDVPRGTSAPATCEVEPAVRDAIACLARDPAKDGIELTIDLEPGLTAAIRPIALQHVLLNLLLNARRAMLPAGGSLTIRGRRSPVQPQPTERDVVGIDAPSGGGGWVVIEVIDTGCGMDAAQLARLFDAFYTHDVPRGTSGGERRRGTGLGMTICSRLIADCGGFLWARSAPGEGTSIVLGVAGA